MALAMASKNQSYSSVILPLGVATQLGWRGREWPKVAPFVGQPPPTIIEDPVTQLPRRADVGGREVARDADLGCVVRGLVVDHLDEHIPVGEHTSVVGVVVGLFAAEKGSHRAAERGFER